MEKGGVEIVYGLFCEFARNEGGGKVTLIGVVGDEIKFDGEPPVMMPNLGLHIFVRTPQQKKLPAKLTIFLPGKATPEELTFETPSDHPSVNLTFNFVGQVFDHSTSVVAKLRIDTKPPVEREFTLAVTFGASS